LGDGDVNGEFGAGYAFSNAVGQLGSRTCVEGVNVRVPVRVEIVLDGVGFGPRDEGSIRWDRRLDLFCILARNA